MIKKILIVASLSISLVMQSQNHADLNSAFSILTGFDDTSTNNNIPVRSLAVQADGKILVAGSFYTLQGSAQNRIVRLNTDGSIDTTFNVGTGFDSTVYKIELQSDGKIVAVGVFNFFNGSPKSYIIRLNTDGSIDSTLDVGNGFDGLLFGLAIQNDGKILVSGFYTNFQNATQRYLIRLNSNGSKDASFNIGSGFDNSVSQIVVQNDGKILVGGVYTIFNGNTQNNLVRLNSDGSKDTTFNIGTGFNYIVNSIQIQTDSKILVGGSFSTFQGVSQKYLVRLNPDGSKDPTFDIGTGFDDNVNSLFLQSNGQVLVGGSFSTYKGISQKKLIRLNSNGLKDTSFDIGSGFGGSPFTYNYGITSIKVLNNGATIIGGKFTNYQGISNTRDLVLLKGNPLSFQSFDKLDFKIYPNPSENYINITNTKNLKIDFIEIYDLQGKILKKQTESSTTIDVSDLQKGMYLLKITSENNLSNQLFIKK